MSLDNTGRLYLERQVTLARVVIAALSLVALLETSGAPVQRAPSFFFQLIWRLALAEALVERFSSGARFRIPLAVDFVVLAVFVYLTPSVSAFWFLFLFAVFALATRGNTRAMLALVGLATAGIILRVAVEQAVSLAEHVALDRDRAGNSRFRPGHGISGRTGARASGAAAVPGKNHRPAAIRPRADRVDSSGARRIGGDVRVRAGMPGNSRR